MSMKLDILYHDKLLMAGLNLPEPIVVYKACMTHYTNAMHEF